MVYLLANQETSESSTRRQVFQASGQQRLSGAARCLLR